jgi:hypothetical protein
LASEPSIDAPEQAHSFKTAVHQPDSQPAEPIKHVVRDCPEYLVIIDEHVIDGKHLYFIHFGFRKFNKSALVTALHDWEVLRKNITVPLMAYSTNEDDKWKAFIKLFGFRPTGVKLVDANGEPREVYLNG